MDFALYLPDDFANPWLALLLVIASFIGSALTAAFSLGGGLLMIALMSALMPAPAVVPVHGVIMLGSNAGRSAILSRHIDWSILLWVSLGSLIGALTASRFVFDLPPAILRLAIGTFILYSQWGMGFGKFHFGPKGFFFAGGISSFLSMFVGATGPFITSILSQRKAMGREEMIATAGASMIAQHGFKVVLFGVAGFAFAPWWPLMAACLISGLAGTWLGTRLLKRMNEQLFRRVLKWMLTAMAIYLFWMALNAWLG